MEQIFRDLFLISLSSVIKLRVCERDGRFYIDLRNFWKDYPTRFGLFLNEHQARDLYEEFVRDNSMIEVDDIKITKKASRFIIEKPEKKPFFVPSNLMFKYISFLPCFFQICTIRNEPETSQQSFLARMYALIILTKAPEQLKKDIKKQQIPKQLDQFLESMKGN